MPVIRHRKPTIRDYFSVRHIRAHLAAEAEKVAAALTEKPGPQSVPTPPVEDSPNPEQGEMPEPTKEN